MHDAARVDAPAAAPAAPAEPAHDTIPSGPGGRRSLGAAENPSDPLAQLFVAERPVATDESRAAAAVAEDPPAHRLARRALIAFVFTFVAARVLVLLIMTGRLPDLFLHVGGTHVHHLTYGIFLLTGVAALLLFARPHGRVLLHIAVAFGIATALTFDEFGMWLHLHRGYWQRASYDAVLLIAAMIGVIAAAPALRRFRQVHWWTAVLLLAALVLFTSLLVESLKYAAAESQRLEQIEQAGPQ